MRGLRADRLRIELARARRPALILAALLVAAAIATAAMLSRQIFVSPLADHYRVQVPVSTAKGVLAGKTEVAISGVPVGLVEEVRLAEGRPVLGLALDPEHGPLYRDASAHLGAITPFQDMYLAIERGSTGGDRIPDGGSLDPARTSVGTDPADVLDTFDADTRARLTTLLNELGRGLPDGGAHLRQSFAELVPLMTTARAVTRELASQEEAVRRVVHNFAGLTGALAKRDRQLTSLVRGGNATLTELGERDGPLAATIAELEPTMIGARRAFAELSRAQSDLDPALRGLRPVAKRLRPGIAALRRLSERALPALRALGPAAGELRPLSTALASSASALDRAFTELRPLAPSVERATSELVPCLPPVGALLRNFASANSFGDSKGSFWRTQLTAGPDSLGGLAGGLEPIPSCARGAG